MRAIDGINQGHVVMPLYGPDSLTGRDGGSMVRRANSDAMAAIRANFRAERQVLGGPLSDGLQLSNEH